MSLSFPIPDWDDDAFSYPDAIISGSYSGKVSVKKKNRSVKRKHDAEGTLKKVQPGNVETPLQSIKKRKTDKTDRVHGDKGNKSTVGPSEDGQKKKKKKVQKDVRDRDHTLEIFPNQEKGKSNDVKLQTETENKSVSHKRKKKRKNNNKYKDLNTKQKAEKIAQNCKESKDSVGNKLKLEQQNSGSTEKNVNMFIHVGTSKEVQSSPKKKVKKKKKINLCESSYNSVSQESSTVSKNNDTAKLHHNGSHDTNIVKGQENKVNHDHSPATNVDVKKKKKKRKSTTKSLDINKSLDSPTLPHNNNTLLCLDTSGCTQNEGIGKELKVKKKNKIKGKKTVEGNIKKKKRMESSMCIKKSERVDDNDEHEETVKKKKKKDNIKENGTLLKVEDTISPKKTKLEIQKTEGKHFKIEDSEAEDMIFDGNEECSEEFNKDFDVFMSSLNFNQFNSTKKFKKKGSDVSGNSEVKNRQGMSKISKMKNDRNSLDEEWGGKDDENIKGVMGKKRKRDSAKTDFKEINDRHKKVRKTNNSDAAEEPKTPVRKGARFNREKLSKLLEEAASMELKNPRPSPPLDPADTLKKRMEDRLMAARFRLVNQELYTKSSTEAKQLFKKDPEAFDVYHHGYQAQVRQWPVNPLDLIITWLSKKPKEWAVADMGCGEATLAQQVPQNRVHSLDLVAASDRVTACDMAHTPLAAASVDVVVFCLSLMGTNLKDFMIEANRILREGGIMKIAEVESRCGNVKEFEKQLGKFGFHCTGRDTSYQYFFLLEFKKNRKLKKTAALPDLHLKPCLYKKR